MTDFYDVIDELLGDADALTDIRITARRCWFYDFNGYPLRVWQGQGRLFTSDGNVWLGTIDASGTDHHQTPTIQDGRNGSSANYTFTLDVPNLPGQSQLEMYNALKADQWRVYNRYLTGYLVVIQQGEALRPQTPIVWFKQLTMQSPTFTEGVVVDGSGLITKKYTASILSKDANFGRSNTPNRSYTDSAQKEYARQMGVTSTADRGCEFLASLASRTYIIP